MGGFGAFLKKELMEILRTWRIWVLPGIVLFMAISSPIIAQLTPALLKSVAQSTPGVVIRFPAPTPTDSYAQWVKDLSQIILIAVIIIAGGLVVGERKSGTAVMVLTKPVSRSGFVIAKTISEGLLVTVATLVGGGICWGLTLAVFGVAPLGQLFAMTGLWLLVAWMFVSLTVLFSVLVNSQAGAAGLGLLGYVVLSTLGAWGSARTYSPAGLLPAMGEMLAGRTPPLAWPIATTLLAIAAFITLSVAFFKAKEL